MTRHGPPPPSSLPPERRFSERRTTGPRRVKGGLRLGRDVNLTRTPLAAQWMKLVESHLPAETLNEGLEYALAGQVVSLQPLAGRVEAQVQGTAARPYTTRLTDMALTEEQWQRMVSAMAHEAIHLASLLAGEMPPSLDSVFASQGLVLLPSALAATCTCAAGADGRCKHVAAVASLIADRLADEPLLMFTLRGLPAERLLERMRQARSLHTHGVAAAHGESIVPNMQPVAPLESMIDDFWRGSGEIDTIDWQSPQAHVPHALLRRLGPSPIAGKFPMVGLLASIYDAVADAARRKGL